MGPWKINKANSSDRQILNNQMYHHDFNLVMNSCYSMLCKLMLTNLEKELQGSKYRSKLNSFDSFKPKF